MSLKQIAIRKARMKNTQKFLSKISYIFGKIYIADLIIRIKIVIIIINGKIPSLFI